MAAAGPANMKDVLGESLERRLDARKHFGLCADHDVELAELSLLRRARERRIDEGDAVLREILPDAVGRGRLACRAIDDDLSGLGRVAEAACPVDDFLHLG